MLDKLLGLGFSEAICTQSIDKTAKVMHAEIDTNPELSVKVLDEVRNDSNPYPVDKDNYNEKLQNWIDRHTEALHREKQDAMLTPFKVIATLF